MTRAKINESSLRLEEADWARRLASTPKWVTSSLLMVASGFIGTFISNPSWGYAVGMATCFLLAVPLIVIRNKREESLQNAFVRQLEDSYRNTESAYRSIIDEMTLTSFMVSHGMTDLNKRPLASQMDIVRTSVLLTVRNRLGPDDGVRACMFVVDPEHPDSLIAGKWGTNGRTDPPSTRRFRGGDKTFDLAIAKLPRFEKDVKKTEENASEPYRYQTFATYPISTDEKLYGILTIDAPSTGDIGERDLALLSFFASILTITFAIQKDSLAIPRSSYQKVCDNGGHHYEEGEA